MRLNLAGRQWKLEIFDRVAFAEFNSIADGTEGFITVPPGSNVTEAITLTVVDAFVGPTTAEAIATNDADDSAIDTADLSSASPTELLAVGYYEEGFRIKIEINKAGAVATAGVFTITGAYVVDKRVNETQTDVRPLS